MSNMSGTTNLGLLNFGLLGLALVVLVIGILKGQPTRNSNAGLDCWTKEAEPSAVVPARHALASAPTTPTDNVAQFSVRSRQAGGHLTPPTLGPDVGKNGTRRTRPLVLPG